MKLAELAAGERFITDYTRRTGYVVHQGDCGTMVKLDKSGKIVTITKKAKWGAKNQEPTVCEFEAPAKPELWSSGTEVTRISTEG